MSVWPPSISERGLVLHLGGGLQLTCRRLTVSGERPRRSFSGRFEPSSEEALTALHAFALGKPVGESVPIVVIDLGQEKAVAVLYSYSRQYIAEPPRVVADLILEEIQPREEVSYTAIDEKTDFTDADYRSCLARLRHEENPCPMKP